MDQDRGSKAKRMISRERPELTFIFTDIFEGKGQVRILPLNNSHLSKGTSADDSQQAEMIQVHYKAVSITHQSQCHKVKEQKHVRLREQKTENLVVKSVVRGCMTHVGDRMTPSNMRLKDSKWHAG
jgi:alpha-acetolactate decarboxylase